MDRRTVESRLREISGGADMIPMSDVKKYTGASYEWIRQQFHKAGVEGIGNTKGKRYHIKDVARALTNTG